MIAAQTFGIELVLYGVITWYAVTAGQPLYCDTGCTDLVVGQVDVPWIAVPVELYDQGWQCGDLVVLSGDGWSLLARAYDAGPLSDYYVEQYGPHVPIVADVPEPLAVFDGLSALGQVLNVSAVLRESRRLN